MASDEQDQNYRVENDLSTFLILNNNQPRSQAPKSNVLPISQVPINVKAGKSDVSQIKNINDLKKLTPVVKLMGQEANNLIDLKRSIQPKKKHLSPEIRLEMSKFCRACAGMKVPMVDIFSLKGKEMRLERMMQHLEEIDELASFSTFLCMDCIYELKASYKFFLQIKKAQMKLKSICSKISASQGSERVEEEQQYVLLQSLEEVRMDRFIYYNYS